MKYIKFLLALLTAAMLPATAPAQNYSLRELLQEGLQNSYSLKIVRNDEQTAANNNTLANAGALPTVSLSAGYSGALDNTKTKERGTGLTTHDRNVLDHTFTAGITADWTLFDGFKIQTNMQRLRELQSQSRIATRVAIEDYIANLTAEYFNLTPNQTDERNDIQHFSFSKSFAPPFDSAFFFSTTEIFFISFPQFHILRLPYLALLHSADFGVNQPDQITL